MKSGVHFIIANLITMSLALLGSYLQLISTSQDLAVLPEDDVPEFSEPIPNITIPVGREAQLPCIVTKLGAYKAAWLRVEDKGILTIHQHVITRNYRLSLTHSDNRNFILVIKNVQESDRGGYMCQINTVPMRSQVGYLDVVVPPKIVDTDSPSTIVVTEGANVTLQCRATGYPSPTIKWRQEKKNSLLTKTQTGETLTIVRVTRVHTGAYLCIASNGVPPSVSRRITLQVNFAPTLWIHNKDVGGELHRDISLECHVEAFPELNVEWIKENGLRIRNGGKYSINKIVDNERSYKMRSLLLIRNLTREDFGTYKCFANNSLGSRENSIKLYETEISTDSSKSAANRRRQNEVNNKERVEQRSEIAVQDAQKSHGKTESRVPGNVDEKSDRILETHQPNHCEQSVRNHILTFIGITILIPLGLT